jgi:hypothetical protein
LLGLADERCRSRLPGFGSSKEKPIAARKATYYVGAQRTPTRWDVLQNLLVQAVRADLLERTYKRGHPSHRRRLAARHHELAQDSDLWQLPSQ